MPMAGFAEIGFREAFLPSTDKSVRGTENTLGTLVYKQTGGTTIIRGLNQQASRGKLKLKTTEAPL